jgi:hypothetical protein
MLISVNTIKRQNKLKETEKEELELIIDTYSLW